MIAWPIISILKSFQNNFLRMTVAPAHNAEYNEYKETSSQVITLLADHIDCDIEPPGIY